MPIYEYHCPACAADFEHWHASLQNLTKPRCPQCGSAEVERRFSAPAIRTSGGAGSSADQGAESEPSKPAVFGRKELNENLRRQGIKPTKD